MMEWKDSVNPFNAMKGLIYAPWYQGVLKGNFLPPITATIDPVNNCRFKCFYCNSWKVINRSKKVQMEWEHLQMLIEYLSGWGVKGVCFAGGGEPALHPNIGEAIQLCAQVGIQPTMITNGDFLNTEQMKLCAQYARWIGVSVDCMNPETFKEMKGVDSFHKVIGAIDALLRFGARELTFKFLINHMNQYSIYAATHLAKTLGCHAIHIRPASYLEAMGLCEEKLDVDAINEQIEFIFPDFEDENFHIYAVKQKTNQDLSPRKKFNKCIASAVGVVLEANGDVNLCNDRRGDPQMKLCSHNDVNEIARAWGSLRHKKILAGTDPHMDCGKCTMTIYNELAEAYEEDKFCWRAV